MSEFEKLLSGFVNDTATGREARVQRNCAEFGLNRSNAELLDELSTGAIIEVARMIGKRVDNIGDLQVRASALLLLPETIALNLRACCEFLTEITVLTALAGKQITPNPMRPDCPCENCQLARAASELLAHRPEA